MEPVEGTPPADPIDRLVIELRAYVDRKPKGGGRTRRWPSGVTVVFDTETTVDPSQRLRFGAYQVRDRGGLLERGVFHAEDMPAADLAILRSTFAQEAPTDAGERLHIRSRAEFVEKVLFAWGYETGGLIIGFNLPFDISRIAIGHTWAKGRFKGGFSFTLAERRPNIRLKHLSQRAAFVEFAGKDGDNKEPDKGFFVDVKTLAASLTGSSHSLQSLTKLLGTTPKSPLESYEGPLTPEMVRYGMNDVQATWECFEKLAERYAAYELVGTSLHELYSEASLGKAFLQAMNIKPWRQVQPRFPPELIGQIMSTYYGGRSEVHIRREIVPVIHCDFRSMYPTVCTLLGLWRFVIAQDLKHYDATEEVRQLVENSTREDLQDPGTWRNLTCIVQVLPEKDIFPVRASYGGGSAATIGLNRLSFDEPLWFTLPDVLAAKLLRGKSPKIIRAIRYAAGPPQPDLHPITFEGTTIRPGLDDFYKLLIDRRGRVQSEEREAPQADKPALSSASQSLKILANATSYGIFVEINVQGLDSAQRVRCYDHRGAGRSISARKIEEPGRYFHPALGALITGAARLMLALAEHNAGDQGLDWAFCDTDSLAIANAEGLPTADFIERVEKVRRWFKPLNPYEKKGSILQLEKVNFPVGHDQEMDKLRPISCLAISAKRYVLFDRDEDGQPIIRKASRHGLGHLLAPYEDPERAYRMEEVGVELWQEDLWRAIIAAHDAGKPDEADFESLPNFNLPAASRYAATNQALLKWFDAYNKAVQPHGRVAPFNFLLSFQPKSRTEMAAIDPDALKGSAWGRRTPHPASRYSSNLIKDQPPVFDRKTSEPFPWEWLKSYGRSLVRHHMHPELKFRGGDYDEHGVLQRRHVRPFAVVAIGKEADNLEEREFLGDDDDDAIRYGMGSSAQREIATAVEASLREYRISGRDLLKEAKVGRRTLVTLRAGKWMRPQSLLRLLNALEVLRREAKEQSTVDSEALELASQLALVKGSVSRLAAELGVTRQYLGRVLRREKPMTEALIERLKTLQALKKTPPR